ncbi:reverse transcriptase domain-containing protein [Tanacetum coccineum]
MALIKSIVKNAKVHKPVPKKSTWENLNRSLLRGHFTYWGLWDIAGPFRKGPIKVKFLIVAMDYFTKWIEAKPVATITGNQVKKFVWENIVCRFGLPGEIISDNGKQFRDNPSRIGGRIKAKARQGKIGAGWKNSHATFGHTDFTMIKSSNEDTPFSLTYERKLSSQRKLGCPRSGQQK